MAKNPDKHILLRLEWQKPIKSSFHIVEHQLSARMFPDDPLAGELLCYVLGWAMATTHQQRGFFKHSEQMFADALRHTRKLVRQNLRLLLGRNLLVRHGKCGSMSSYTLNYSELEQQMEAIGVANAKVLFPESWKSAATDFLNAQPGTESDDDHLDPITRVEDAKAGSIHPGEQNQTSVNSPSTWVKKPGPSHNTSNTPEDRACAVAPPGPKGEKRKENREGRSVLSHTEQPHDFASAVASPGDSAKTGDQSPVTGTSGGAAVPAPIPAVGGGSRVAADMVDHPLASLEQTDLVEQLEPEELTEEEEEVVTYEPMPLFADLSDRTRKMLVHGGWSIRLQYLEPGPEAGTINWSKGGTLECKPLRMIGTADRLFREVAYFLRNTYDFEFPKGTTPETYERCSLISILEIPMFQVWLLEERHLLMKHFEESREMSPEALFDQVRLYYYTRYQKPRKKYLIHDFVRFLLLLRQ